MTTKKNRSEYIYQQLELLFPQAKCELEHRNNFELLVAVTLSAQTTDKNVNAVTPVLFERYPDAYALSQASQKDVEEIIRTIGLYRNKAKNIIALSQKLVEEFEGIVPGTMDELTSLPGVGRKTANVVLAECFGIPAIAVDTHVSRVARRLKIAREDDSVEVVEEKLRKYFPSERWIRLHHLMIFFGRYQCTARNPKCEGCPFNDFCRDYKKSK